MMEGRSLGIYNLLCLFMLLVCVHPHIYCTQGCVVYTCLYISMHMHANTCIYVLIGFYVCQLSPCELISMCIILYTCLYINVHVPVSMCVSSLCVCYFLRVSLLCVHVSMHAPMHMLISVYACQLSLC